MIRLAINGYGRIGRCVLRALYESDYRRQMQIVAINEPADLATIVHLTKYDSTHGRFPGQVSAADQSLVVNGDRIAVTHHRTLDEVHWAGVDVVLECTGHYDSRETVSAHLEQGASYTLLSQPGQSDIPAIVFGINEKTLDDSAHIASAASCTTNCIVPVIDVLDRAFGIETGTITTIHSAMNDQPVLDAYHHTDLRKTRAAGLSMIPVDTGLAAGIGRILPNLDGKFTSRALRIPTHNVSAMEMTVHCREAATVEAANRALLAASEGQLRGLLGVSNEPLASCDFNHDPRSGVVDAGQTRVSGQLINVLVWFDNEWGYANRMLDVVSHWQQ
ncbi:glyceraldehyde-3-phosphate dehydrogenase type I [Litorivivens lipolytica]|uniref:Glyceraldehyde-3-phosphate dehydrogenase type I n=1 Tax=Litorivivens lipolytica TaxID=1524264 RepID=A0A7W4W4P1_9GAMM|nr:glyceraldehyde 3-phosphate dehydrogenase NAD-binding domain-containing protein [Litorivivens lipolytica]MBB3047349.1 glyceraldehyde-3-phosphate dehydrogenase type I [Litorivivens lipolytica]